MESTKENSKRKKDKQHVEDDYQRERRSKRPRSKSRSPARRGNRESGRRRKYSRSRSPERRPKQERGTQNEPVKGQEIKKDITERKIKDTDMLNTRTGGAYIPPARLRMMQAQITDKSSMAYQRLAWEALKKSIHGHINKINVGNIGIIIKQLLKENIVRGRGLLCRSVIQAQAASPTFTNVYAALVAAVNSRFPNIGELLLKRLVIQFKRGFKRNDKPICISSASFIAHLVNQRVAHEILALELLTLLVETPTDDSVEVAIAFLKESGQKLTEVSSKGVNAIFEMLRNILHEGQLDKRVQYMIEVMFQVWKDGFKDHPALIEELELVPEEEQFTHLLMLDDATDPQDILNVFKLDDKYEENEQKYKTLSKEILGSDAESGEEGGSDESGSEESDDEEQADEQKGGVTIIDNTETNLVALRRTIYLTINSSLDFEECAHKLMKMQLKPGQEVELCHMFLDCCAEQRTYEKFYGLLAQRFCNINRMYIGPFEEIFKDSYGTAHRLDTNRLRNVSKFFAHLLFTDSISWEVLECVKLNEEDTTSSSRIYIKILFQELAEYMGLKKLNDRLKDPTLQGAFSGIFPRDNPKNTRFSINFFTSIGLGGLTDALREHLKQMPKNVPAPLQEITVDSESDSSSSSSSSSDDDSSSDSSSSESDSEKKKDDKKRKNNEKSDKNPQTEATEGANDKVERWGHSGFYDTYGNDARRYERTNKEKDGERDFAPPRNAPRRNDGEKGRYKEKNSEDRRRNSGQHESDRDDTRTRRRDEREDGNKGRKPRESSAERYQKRQNNSNAIEDENHSSKRTSYRNDSRQSDRDANRGYHDSNGNDKNPKSRSKPYKDDRDNRGRPETEEHNRSKNKTNDDKSASTEEKRSTGEKGEKDTRKDHPNSEKSRYNDQRDKNSNKDVHNKKYVEERSSEEDANRKKDNSRKDYKSDNSEEENRSDRRKKSKKKKSRHESPSSDSKRREERRYYEDEASTDKTHKKNSKKNQIESKHDDGWDIRGSSIKRELGERYWNK